MKNLLITCVIVVLLVAGNAFCAEFTVWTNASGDGDWNNAANWNNGVPGYSSTGDVEKICLHIYTPGLAGPTMSGATADDRWISLGGIAPGQYTIEMKGNATHTSTQALYMQSYAATAPYGAVSNFNMYDTSHYTLTHGTDGSGAYLQTGQFAGGTSNFRMYNSSQLTALYSGLTFGDNANHGNLYVNDNARIGTVYVCLGGFQTNGGAGAGTMYVSGNAQVNMTDRLYLAVNQGSTATIYQSGGVISATNAVVEKGFGTINVSGGVMNITNALGFSAIAQGGTITVTGGIINAGTLTLDALAMTDPMTVSDLGRVIIPGDQTALVQGYIDGGALVCSTYTFDGTNTIIGAQDSTTVLTRPTKICQLIGDWDKERNKPTINLTGQRYNLPKTDLGVPFTHKGRTYLLFGDTWTAPVDDDPIAVSDDKNLEDGLSLTFLTNPNGHYRPVQIPGVSLSSFEVPMEGVSVNGKMYIYATTGHTPTVAMGRSVLAVSNDDGYNFSYLYDFSSLHFINVSILKVLPSEWKGLPDFTGEGLVIFGSGQYRASNVRLAFQPADQIETPSSRLYFSGLTSGQPTWSSVESDAVALFDQPQVGELSVSYNKFIRKWIMLYNANNPRGINMRTADNPWGPWSGPQVVFDPWVDGGYCHFMHTSWESSNCDSVYDAGREDEWGGEYGPYQFKDLATGNPHTTTIYFTMSTWNPYTVVLMKAVLERIYLNQCESIDYDRNNIIDFKDFANFAQYWITDDSFADLTGEGVIDIEDLQYFCSCWLYSSDY